jgi:hypothetical protein
MAFSIGGSSVKNIACVTANGTSSPSTLLHGYESSLRIRSRTISHPPGTSYGPVSPTPSRLSKWERNASSSVAPLNFWKNVRRSGSPSSDRRS